MSLLEKDYQLSLGNIDPEFQRFMQQFPLPRIKYEDLASFKLMAKNQNAAALAALNPYPRAVKTTKLEYLTADSSRVRAKLYQPAHHNDRSPLIVMFHGGCFCIGAPESEELICRNLVQAFGVVCISPAYRLAPEFKFPYAPDDAWDLLKWVAANAKSWNADPLAGFIVGGTSAGAGLAVMLSHMARDEHLYPPLTGQYLAAPMIPQSKTPKKYERYMISYEQNKDAPVLPLAGINMFKQAYQPNEDDNIRYTPFNHPNGHHNLPPAFFSS